MPGYLSLLCLGSPRPCWRSRQSLLFLSLLLSSHLLYRALIISPGFFSAPNWSGRSVKNIYAVTEKYLMAPPPAPPPG